MDEQVIDDLYARAQSKGYKKERLDFIQLIQSDEDVFNDMYQYVQSKGYKKDSENFSFLIGKTEAPAVKKKEETVTDFVSEPGSLVLPEPEVAVAETVVEEEVVQPVVADATRVEEPVLPTEQIEQPDLEDFVVYEDPGAEIVTEAEGEKNTWVEDFAGKNFVTDFFGDIYRAGAAGQAQGGSVDESLELMTKGKDVTDEDIQDFLAAQERMASQGESDEMKEFNKIYEANGSGWLGFFKGTAANPTILPQLFVSSVSAMATPATIAAGAAGAGTGAAIGATGFSAGPLGVFTTAGGALTGAMGAMGTTLETGLAFSEFLQEELEKKGLEMTTEGIRKVLEDPEAIKSMRYRAAGRGIAIGAFNAVTAGVGSQVVKSVAKATGRKAVAGLAGAGVEVVSESTGEVAGRLVAGQEMDVAEIGFEGFAGGVPQVVGLGRGLYKSPTYKVNGETVSGPVAADFIKNAPVKDLVGATLEIKNDPVLKDIAIKRREDARMDAIIKAELAKAGITDEGAVTALTKLEKERRGLEGNGTRAAQQRLAEVNKEIDGLMDGAKIAYTETVDASGDKVTTEVIVTKEYAREELIKDGIESPTEQQVEAKQAELFEDAMEAVEKPQEDAIQEQGPESVDAPESTRDSEAVGEGVPDIGEPTTEVEAQDDVTDEAPAPTTEVAVDEGAEVELGATTTDKKGRALRFFKTTTEKDGVKTTRFTLNRSDKPTEHRNKSRVTPVEEALGGLYEFEIIEGLQERGVKVVAVTEVREGESGAAASVIFEQDGQRFEGDVVLTPKKSAPKKTVSEPTQEVTEEEQVDIDEFFGEQEIEGVEKVSENLVINRRQMTSDTRSRAKEQRTINRVKQFAIKAAVSLSKQFPDVRIVLHETPNQYKRFAGELARGSYDYNNKTVHINLTNANLQTVAHEVFHALILEKALDDPNAVILSRKMLESVKKTIDPNSEFAQKIDKFVDSYADRPIVQDEEYLAELTGMLAAQYKTLDKPAQNAIKEFFRKLAKLIGIDKKFGLDEYFGPEFLKTDAEVVDLMNTISRKIRQGVFIESSDLAVMEKIKKKSTPEELKKARKDVEVALDKQERSKREKAESGTGNRRKETAVTPRQQVQEKLIQRSQAASNFTDEELTAFAKEGILFHGSDMQQEFFDSKFIKEFNYGYGFYFTGVPALARKYGDKLSFVDTKEFKLLDGDEDITQEDAQDMLDNLPGYGLDNEFVEEFLQDYIDDEGFENDPQSWSMFITEYISDYESKAEIFSEYLESELGFDGMTTVENAGKGAVPTVAVVWNFDFLNENILQDPTKGKVVEEEATKEVTRKEEAAKDVLDFVSLVSKGTSEDVIYLNNRKATEENLLNRSQEYVQDFDELERLNNEGVMFHFGPVDVQEVIPEKLKRMVSGYGVYFVDKAESPTTYSLYASRYGKRVTLVDGSGMNLVDSGSKISKEEFTTLMDTFNKEVAALDEVSPEITELSEYLNELDLDLQGANPTWYEMLTTMSPDLLPSDSDFFLGGVIDKAYNYTNPQKMFIAEVTDKALGYDGATTIVGKGSIEEHSAVNVWNFDKVNKNIISDEAVTPRMQIADAATSIQESLKFADKSSLPNKLEFKRALQERFDNEVYPLIKERYGVKDNRSNTDQGLKDYLVDAYLNETLTAIEAYPDALGWYDARITGAMSLMEKLHPELATDKDAASTFKIALAITSNGNKVYDNFVEANRQYEYFKENGKFDDSYSIGDQRAGILSTLAFTNKALESMSMADFTAFLTTKYRAGDLKYMKDGKKTPLLPGFAVDEEVYGASIFGPKIGNGFFMNLYGEFNQLTMDRWFMRQFGRLTGTLLDYDQKKVDAGTKRLNRATKALAKRNGAKLSDMIPGWDKMSAEELSNKIQKASMDLKKRAIFKSNPKLDEVRKAGNNLSKQVSAEVEAPRNSSQRKFINEVFTELQAKLKNDYDIDITIADLQAVNWYPEKALYQTFKADQSTKTGKVETSDNEQPDYESAAKKLVEEQGVSKKEIKEDEARRSKQLERNTANREAIEQRAGELNKDDIEASEVKRLKDKIISVKEDVTSSDLEEGVAPRQQVVYHVTIRDNKGNIQKKGLEKDRPPTFAKGVMGTAVFDTAGKSFAFSNLEDATKWGIKTKIEKDKEVSIVAVNAEGKNLQEDKAVTEDPFNPLSSAVFTEDVISPSDILSIEDVDYKFGKPFDKNGQPLTEESFDIKDDIAPRQQLSDIATPLPRQQKSVREVVQQARDNNFKDAATKDFLTRKGVPTADIDKAIKSLDDVYARVMKEIDGVITKSQKRGVDFDTQLKNALAYLQGTKLYEDTTDIHREKLMREVRAKFDKKEKRAPSAKRILGNIKDVKKVTLSEKEALKMQLRLVAKTAKTTARALVVAGNELTKSLKEMVKGGVITANQMSSVLRRFSRVDLFNPASIDSFLDYMAKIFADAEYGAKIARIKKLLPRAKKNIKSKIGVADVLGDTLTKLFNVNPTLIPMEMLEDYQNLLEMMGAAKKVLPLADINDVTEIANKLLNAVYEEISMAEDLAEVFANYENKVIKDGKLDYAATIDAMIADQTISLEEAAVMRKYKSRIVEPTKKEPKTEAEIAEERAELMSAVEAAKVNVSRLVMEEERTLARQLAKLMGTEAIERLSNQQLETLLAVIDNINNGFVTHAAQRLAETMNASNRAESLSESVAKAKPLSVSTFIGKIKAGITKNNKFFESVKRNPLAYLDQVFGDFKTTRIYDAIFKPLAQAYDKFSLEMNRVDERLTNAQNAVMKSFKNDPNKARMSSYKMMAYMLQREFEANPDNKQVNPAADFIRATIDHINKGQSFFKGKDAEMLQQILDDFGGEQIDSQKLYDSFNKAERNALAVMEDINKSMGSKAVFTGAVIRGRRVDALNQYAHHNVLSTSGQMDRSADVSIIEAYNQSMRASTKAKNLIERTGVATPLNFDVFSSVSRGSRFTLTDFYLTEPIRTSRKTISDTRKLLEERGDVTKQENEIVNSIENALELALDDLLTRTFSQSTMIENVVQYVKKTGYRLVLASATRAGAEYLSNVNFAVIYAPKDFAAGMANKKMVMGTVGIDVMSNLKSTQLSRMYPNEVLSGRMIDTSVLGEKAGDKGGRAKSDVLNKATQIYNGLLAPAKKGIEAVADTLISAPDKAVIRPLWFGSFENAFVEITGKKPDFDKIAANDEAYMAANQEALDKATDTADQVTTLAGAADNPFKSMLRGKYPSKAKQTALLQFFNNFNSFMTRFLIYEYISARTAVNAMLGNGMISKRQGAALLGAVVTRMVTYTLLNTVFALLLKQAFGLGDEEDEKDIEKQFGQALASTAVSLIVGRDFGNVVKGLLNYGVENLNEEFLDELRDGDYDPYRDSIAYTFVPADKEYKSNTLADYIRNLMGPFGTFYKMAEFGVKALSADEKKDPAARLRQLRELNERLPLEVLGNLGLIPLYRDIRALLLADIYKDMGKEKKGGKTGMTKAEKAQMKEYFPELYEMQMQMEEDMKNPELERFEKEMKLLEKQIEESLKQRRQ